MSQELRFEARQRERERARLDAARAQLAQDLRSLADLPAGRRLFRHLIDHGGIFRGEHLPGVAGAYQAGRKAAALRLWHMLRGALPHRLFTEIVLPAPAPEDGDEIAVADEAADCL